MNLAQRYIIFAVIATVANISGQDLVTRVYAGPWVLWASIFFGTGVGLVVKYMLDKKYIFNYQSKDLAHDSKLFFLYSIMGVLTTVIFWGVEFAFDAIFATKTMRYVGGAIGLAIGYIVKYQLDKRFVFTESSVS